MADYTFEKSLPYGLNSNNYEAEGEIMVKITLNEYRGLVSDVARLKSENETLAHDVECLELKIDALQGNTQDQDND